MMGAMKHKNLPLVLLSFLLFSSSVKAHAQTCLTASDMDAPTRSALEAAGKRYFEMAARGDAAGMKQNSIAALAADFSGVETAVKDNQSALAGVQPTLEPPFLLKAEGDKPLERAEFLCGVFSKNGQTANSAAFVIPNLAPGSYAVVILGVPGPKAKTVSFVLQQQGAEWKIGGFYVRASQAAGHDYSWYAEKARAFKAKGQDHDAWLYFTEARELASPLTFMYTQKTDKLYDESQGAKPADMPAAGSPTELAAAGKTYKLTTMFAVAVGDELDVVVKYQVASVSNTDETFKENMAVIHALVAKYPELREAFTSVVARAVEPSGRDYGAMLPMKEIK